VVIELIDYSKMKDEDFITEYAKHEEHPGKKDCGMCKEYQVRFLTEGDDMVVEVETGQYYLFNY
jgi:hypothetical protein